MGSVESTSAETSVSAAPKHEPATDPAAGVGDRRATWVVLAKAMRPHHWVKNLLVFAPVIFHHAVFDPWLMGLSTLAFVLFCATSSAIYLVNDVLDAKSDRKHPVKRFRPIASGDLTMEVALSVAGALLVATVAVSTALLPWGFLATLVIYIVVNAAYSLWLKQKVMIDVVVLAAFYSLRILAGGEATGIEPSEWLLALSLFLFLSLAFLKRYCELVRLREEGALRTDDRGYRVVDIEMLQTMGLACGYLAVLVLALYINSNQVVELYRHPRVVWLVCPLLLYWVSRTWIWAHRGAIHEDPVLFALRDRTSWIVVLLVVLLGIFATL
ncbi:MAG: UbiA family prenyltransferase [Planctomycetota bacterium]|nr:MAG: UbiA family prenyltransferase [Planctomycetota bacterium]